MSRQGVKGLNLWLVSLDNWSTRLFITTANKDAAVAVRKAKSVVRNDKIEGFFGKKIKSVEWEGTLDA